MKILKHKAQKIRWFIMDVDGVLTDGKIIYDNHGNELKNFSVKDGLGISLLHKAGIKTAIITGRNSEIVKRRAEELKISELAQNANNKLKIYRELKKKYRFTDEEALYIGDDYNDLPVLKKVHFPITVPSAPELVKKECIYVTENDGGNGAVREVAELLLSLQGKLEDAIKGFLEDGVGQEEME
ncbi:KdsC family phosphatase [Persephonella sp.]